MRTESAFILFGTIICLLSLFATNTIESVALFLIGAPLAIYGVRKMNRGD